MRNPIVPLYLFIFLAAVSLVSAVAPTANQATITQPINYPLLSSDQDFLFNCNATDPENNYLSFNYRLYANDNIIAEGNTTYYENITGNPGTIEADQLNCTVMGFDNNYIDHFQSANPSFEYCNFTYTNTNVLTSINMSLFWSTTGYAPVPANWTDECVQQANLVNAINTSYRLRSLAGGQHRIACYNGTIFTDVQAWWGVVNGTYYREIDTIVGGYVGLPQNTIANFHNQTNNLSAGDTIVLSCQAFDGISTSGWVNSTTYSMSNLQLLFSRNISYLYQDLTETDHGTEEYLFYNKSSTEGILNIFINNETSGNTWSQFYTVYYEGATISENITIMNQSDTDVYYRITDAMGTNLENAVIRVFQSHPDHNDGAYEFIGQLMSDADGLVNFFVDSAKYTKITVELDNYETNLDWSNYVAHNNSASIPYTIVMQRENSGIQSFLFHTDYITLDKTQNITGFIQSNDETSVFTVNTQYRITNSLPQKTMYTGQIDDYQTILPEFTHMFILDSATDYNTTNNDDITLFIYDDGVQIVNRTIEYIATNDTIIIDLNATYTSRSERQVVTILLILGLLAFVVLAQFIFRSVNQDIGFHTFMVGMVLLAFLYTPFIIPAIITTVYYAMKPFRQLIGVE